MAKQFDTNNTDKMFDEIQKDMEAFMKGMIDDNQTRMIDHAPEDSGALKNSIRVGINQEVVVYEEGNHNPEQTKMLNSTEIEKYTLGDEVTIIVGAPYGEVIEQGSSTHTPQPFVITAAEELEQSANYSKLNLLKYRK